MDCSAPTFVDSTNEDYQLRVVMVFVEVFLNISSSTIESDKKELITVAMFTVY